MKSTYLLLVLLLLGCTKQSDRLSAAEVAQIKDDIIERSQKHAKHLIDLDYQEIMTFYADVDDFVVFGDGYYWGDYKTIDGIWRDFTAGVKKMLKWDWYEPKIHVFSKDIASCSIEFYNERIGANGDTTRGHGCFSYSMQKIDGDWKVVTMHVTHNYNVYDSAGKIRKWWLRYSPENRQSSK